MAVKKTALGAQVMKDRSVSLSAQQRSALILCDGNRSAQDVVRLTSAVGVTLEDIKTLEALELVEITSTVHTATVAVDSAAVAASPAAASQTAVSSASSDNLDFADALNAAITLCSGLGFKGFSLNMALTGADSIDKLQKLAPEIRRAAGEAKYKPLHVMIFGKPL